MECLSEKNLEKKLKSSLAKWEVKPGQEIFLKDVEIEEWIEASEGVRCSGSLRGK